MAAKLRLFEIFDRELRAVVNGRKAITSSSEFFSVWHQFSSMDRDGIKENAYLVRSPLISFGHKIELRERIQTLVELSNRGGSVFQGLSSIRAAIKDYVESGLQLPLLIASASVDVATLRFGLTADSFWLLQFLNGSGGCVDSKDLEVTAYSPMVYGNVVSTPKQVQSLLSSLSGITSLNITMYRACGRIVNPTLASIECIITAADVMDIGNLRSSSNVYEITEVAQ